MASASIPAATAAGASGTASSASLSSSSSTTAQRCPPVKAAFFRLVPRPRLHLVSSSKVYALQSNDSVASKRQPGVSTPLSEENADAAPSVPMSAEAVSEFITQVTGLVKLVDSRDITELQLKQQGCELVIRKKEALPQPALTAPIIMMQPHETQPVMQPQPIPPPPVAPAPTGVGALPASPPPPASASNSAKSSFPPLKSPMAGTFYRSPGPGQPPFVKVGDKVNKGQVLCIIEAMKLMNEIEADQAGTVADILVDDAKTVCIDQPLFVIEP